MMNLLVSFSLYYIWDDKEKWIKPYVTDEKRSRKGLS